MEGRGGGGGSGVGAGEPWWRGQGLSQVARGGCRLSILLLVGDLAGQPTVKHRKGIFFIKTPPAHQRRAISISDTTDTPDTDID